MSLIKGALHTKYLTTRMKGSLKKVNTTLIGNNSLNEKVIVYDAVIRDQANGLAVLYKLTS